ncbi:MAG: hypothetical protein ACRD4R_13880 [Candidatus Acidiferrales bacterium]
MGNEQQSERTATEASQSLATSQNYVARAEGARPSWLVAKLRFIRMMLWLISYSTAALFLMSIIIFHGLRMQSKIFGGALVLALALIAVSYGLQWHS